MKIKKISAVVLATLIIAAFFAIPTFATTEITVKVTISDGTLALAQEEIKVTDLDGDEILTINDALLAAHNAKFTGGAEAGYSAVLGDYGLSIHKLWGVENGQSYGYYVNNASAYSLTDPINEGDLISAFAYTDLVGWSDKYCYFSENTVTAETNKSFKVTLSMASFDADWNPVTLPVEGAEIIIDGVASGIKTNADGEANITLSEIGTYTISAASDTENLVPTALIVEAFMGVVTANTTVSANPATSDSSLIIYAAVMILPAIGLFVNKKNEK